MSKSMDQQITEKLEALSKFVPFIDFLLGYNKEKYNKFVIIKQWIVEKKRYPLSDLEKIEQSIKTQYKNLTVAENVKIPSEIKRIFVDESECVDLCESDDENDDELEIVSSSFPQKAEDKKQIKFEKALDITSVDLMKRIEEISNADQKNSYPESHVYHDTNNDNREKNEPAISRKNQSTTSAFNVGDIISLESSDEEVEEALTVTSSNRSVKKTDCVPTKYQTSNDHRTENERSTKNSTITMQIASVVGGVSNSLDVHKPSVKELPVPTQSSIQSKHNNTEIQNDISLNTKPSENIDNTVPTQSGIQSKPNNTEIQNNASLNTKSSENVGNTSNKENKASKVDKTPSNSNENQQLKAIIETSPSKVTNNDIIKSLTKYSTKELVSFINDINPVNTNSKHTETELLQELEKRTKASGSGGYTASAGNSKTDQTVANSPSLADTQVTNVMPAINPRAFQQTGHDYQQQQPTQMLQQTSNVKTNFNDPRVRKLLAKHQPFMQTIGIEYPMGNISMHQNPSPLRTTECTPTLDNYLKRKAEEDKKRQEDERKRLDEEERKRQEQERERKQKEERIKAELNDIAKRDQQKQTEKIRDVLSSLPQTKIASVLKQLKKDNNDKNLNVAEVNNKKNDLEQKSAKRMNRVIKEIECDVKGFNELSDYLGQAVGGKRRSSVHARALINEQLSSHGQSLDSGKRRSSINARSAISEQLETHASESDNDASSSQSTNESVSHWPVPKRRKTNEDMRQSYVVARSAIAQQLKAKRTSDDEESMQELTDFEKFRLRKLRDKMIRNQPVVRVKRLTDNQIRYYTERKQCIASSSELLEVQLVQSKKKSVLAADTAVSKVLPKRLNNNCEMTESNTKSCVLCSSKPSDLTDHYVSKHDSESYVSRLTWSQLDELSINTPFAKVVPNINPLLRIPRYAVKCPFCDDELVGPLMDLYNHYSIHTGEYAFECTGCLLAKPFKADIKSHQMHCGKCRTSLVKTLYRYPANILVVYLHFCTLCNFVQLNEANIEKHLRDHHKPREAIRKNVDKCILVAISDGPDTNSEVPTEAPSNLNDKTPQNLVNITQKEQKVYSAVDNMINAPKAHKNSLDMDLDDNIPVCNEAVTEELFDSSLCNVEKNRMPASPKINKTLPMTQIHGNVGNSLESSGKCLPPPYPTSPFPVPKKIKTEPNVSVEENLIITPPRPSVQKIITTQGALKPTYRSYPLNVQYLGLYKCMADDCYFSSDSANELLAHLNDHAKEQMSGDYLKCAYCFGALGAFSSSQQLIDHIGAKHLHMTYQCSVCCYRSCDASNVLVHQKEYHPKDDKLCMIYKCPGIERLPDVGYTNEKIVQNVRKLTCPYCSHKSFYNSQLLEHHIKTAHKMHIKETLTNYSCIYCPVIGKEQSELRKHLAIQHADEFPYLCDHNNTISGPEDLVENLTAINLCVAVPTLEVNTPLDKESNNSVIAADIKPTDEELVKVHEETVKVKLRKITQKTGIAPDILFHCPEKSCGGFFSIYSNWMRHMRKQHNTMVTPCPHCPTKVTRTLEDFETHFETHRRHTYICFHCPITFASRQCAENHYASDHNLLGPSRFEQIRYNVTFSYFIVIQSDLLKNRLEFMTTILETMNARLKDLDKKETKNFKRNWLISPLSVAWLEDYAKKISGRKLRKCFNSSCDFRTKDSDLLHKHVRENHLVNDTKFSCNRCDFQLQKLRGWDGVVNHVKQHFSKTGLSICGACTFFKNEHIHLINHIRSEHAARDVPIINLLRKGGDILHNVSVVFASERLSFSTMQNCFCCEERNMKGDAFILHLKRHHKFAVNYVCDWCEKPIESLEYVHKHFEQEHTRNNLRIRCELASKIEFTVISLNPLQMIIGKQEQKSLPLQVVKQEGDTNAGMDDSVIMLEDDDVVIENHLKDQENVASTKEKPSLKCIPLGSLLKPASASPASASPAPSSEQNFSQNVHNMPRIKIVSYANKANLNLLQNPTLPTNVAKNVENPANVCNGIGSRVNMAAFSSPSLTATNVNVTANKLANTNNVSASATITSGLYQPPPIGLRKFRIIPIPSNSTSSATNVIQISGNNITRFPQQQISSSQHYINSGISSNVPANNFINTRLGNLTSTPTQHQIISYGPSNNAGISQQQQQQLATMATATSTQQQIASPPAFTISYVHSANNPNISSLPQQQVNNLVSVSNQQPLPSTNINNSALLYNSRPVAPNLINANNITLPQQNVPGHSTTTQIVQATNRMISNACVGVTPITSNAIPLVNNSNNKTHAQVASQPTNNPAQYQITYPVDGKILLSKRVSLEPLIPASVQNNGNHAYESTTISTYSHIPTPASSFNEITPDPVPVSANGMSNMPHNSTASYSNNRTLQPSYFSNSSSEFENFLNTQNLANKT